MVGKERVGKRSLFIEVYTEERSKWKKKNGQKERERQIWTKIWIEIKHGVRVRVTGKEKSRKK